MSTHPIPSGSAGVPPRPITPIVIPIGVILCMSALVAWSAWPVLRPSRTIEVTQAIIVPANGPGEPAPSQSDDARPNRSSRTVQAAGWLEAEPYYTAATALADGIIEEMLVLEGDRVRKGQALARMVDEDARLRLAQAEADLQSAQAQLELAEAELEAARRNWEEPFELRRAVSSGRASLDERRAELQQLPSLIRAEEAQLNRAREELRTIEEAYRNNAASEIELIIAREQVNAQIARLEAIMAREPILTAAIARLESDLLAAETALRLRIEDARRLAASEAGVRRAQAEVERRKALRDEARLELDRMTVRSPIDGIVQRRLKAPGDKVIRSMDSPHSAHIVHLYDPQKLQVRVDIPLADASQIRVGQRCEVVVEVLPDTTFQGEVIIVTHEADLQKNTLQAKVRVLDPDPILRPEMLTRVKFLADDAPTRSGDAGDHADSGTARVPAKSIDTRDGSPRVWVVADRANGRGVLRPVPVTPLQNGDDSGSGASSGWVTVSGQIHPGTLIAADPSACAPGERVRLAPSKGGSS